MQAHTHKKVHSAWSGKGKSDVRMRRRCIITIKSQRGISRSLARDDRGVLSELLYVWPAIYVIITWQNAPKPKGLTECAPSSLCLARAIYHKYMPCCVCVPPMPPHARNNTPWPVARDGLCADE